MQIVRIFDSEFFSFSGFAPLARPPHTIKSDSMGAMCYLAPWQKDPEKQRREAYLRREGYAIPPDRHESAFHLKYSHLQSLFLDLQPRICPQLTGPEMVLRITSYAHEILVQVIQQASRNRSFWIMFSQAATKDRYFTHGTLFIMFIYIFRKIRPDFLLSMLEFYRILMLRNREEPQ